MLASLAFIVSIIAFIYLSNSTGFVYVNRFPNRKQNNDLFVLALLYTGLVII